MFTHFQGKVESGKNHTRGACISFKCLHKHLQCLAKSNQALTNSVMLLDYTVPHCNCALCEVSFESTETNLLKCDIVCYIQHLEFNILEADSITQKR